MPPIIQFALDFGGSKLAAALYSPIQRRLIHERRVLCPAGMDGLVQYETMLGLVEEMLTDTQAQPEAVGVSFGGLVWAEAGVVRENYHNPGWQEAPLTEWLRRDLGLPALMDNDANVAALGEYRFGAGQQALNMLYVTVSTGVGGGWIINGQPYRGASGWAGEIGHLQIETGPAAMVCSCGRWGCVEAEASGRSIAKRAHKTLADQPEQGTILRQLVNHDLNQLTGFAVSQAASQGDSLSQNVLRKAGQQLGRGLALAINLMNPNRVVIGGGVSKADEVWWQAVRESTHERVIASQAIDLVPAQLGDAAPLWGRASDGVKT